MRALPSTDAPSARTRSSVVAATALLTMLLAAPATAATEDAVVAPASDGRAPDVAPALPDAADDEGDEPEWEILPPSPETGTTTALVVSKVRALRHAARGRVVWRIPAQTTWSGQPMVLMVLESVVRGGERWLRVRLPIRPHGSQGWIPADAVVLGRTDYWVDVHRRARRVTVRHRGRVVRRFRAVVGARGTPTPRGLAAVYERNRQPDRRGFLGPWAVALTATSQVLQEFDGGPGRIGIHGRGGDSLRDPLGSARSHGCVRVSNADVSWFVRKVPAGAPVRIH
ncbi:MAG: L,D-transpeptidase [Solirubrobacteraceae bacterium]|nr:L,D-transpeptidase [Solirubrobacteraceae bacterium]